MTSPRALGHNKFLVICDGAEKPRWVWTGSQNWTKTGLCTQANNSVLIDDPELAAKYRDQWDRLEDAGDATPDDLKTSNTKPRKREDRQGRRRGCGSRRPSDRSTSTRRGRSSLGAKQAILFLMFNPGPSDTLLNAIIDKARAKVARQAALHPRRDQPGPEHDDESGASCSTQGNSEKADFEVVLPAAIDEATQFFWREMKKLPGTFAMVHSKVVLVDPFGEHPVLLTGSHNLGPKASGTNDENLLIIEDAPGLAAAYATNIMAIYNQYRWRFRRQVQPVNKRWKGLKDADAWQNGYLKPGSRALREIDFWVGE